MMKEEKYGLLLSIVYKVKVFKNKELIREGYCIFINKQPGSALSGDCWGESMEIKWYCNDFLFKTF